MMEVFLTIGIVLYLFTRYVFKPPKQKSVDDELGDAIKKYLKEGVKVRKEG
jgi:hypothetical protein